MIDLGVVQHWLAFHFGIDHHAGPDPWPLWWQGPGSDIGEITILGAVLGLLRQYNCHEHHCPWPGHPVTTPSGATFRACHRHHPLHPRRRRSLPRGALQEIFHGPHQPERTEQVQEDVVPARLPR